MAGNIPPLVSTTPPPLNAFDDEEEEEEDEFGLYNAAEDIEYNDCISYKEKDNEKQDVPKSKREQDSTSQDSATDSGLCPDSEGMSPTPHSDEEKALKQNSCDKLCQNTSEQPQSCVSELSDSQGDALVNHKPVPNLPNGHAEEDRCEEEFDDDFGNFEFAPSKVQTEEDRNLGKDISRSISPSDKQQYNEGENVAGDVSNNEPCSENIPKKQENGEEFISDFSLLVSNSNGSIVDDTLYLSGVGKNCTHEQSNAENNEFTLEKLDIPSSNESSSYNSVDSSQKPKSSSPSQSLKFEQNYFDSKENAAEEVHEDGLESTKEELDYREKSGNQTPHTCSDDDEFDDFTDFKAEFPGCDTSPRSDSVDQLNEHSKTSVEQTKPEEAVLSLPDGNHEESDDEFSNFADFSSSDCAFTSAQSGNSVENVSPHIPLKLDDSDLRTESEFQDWASVFPCEDVESSLAAVALLRPDDVVWSRLFPLESSPALSYQWIESLANRHLLTALNIDSRNILFTPWSISAVPRFAANLSCGPLEPIKATEPLQPLPTTAAAPAPTTTATTTTTTTGSTVQESVPDAHFDWVGSGLTNPLDCPKTVLNLPKTLSAEAENILITLPDISFMRKTYIDFPISEA